MVSFFSPPGASNRLEAADPGVAAYTVEGGIDAANGADPVAVVVHDLVGTEIADEVMVVGACGRDDASTTSSSDLHNEVADATGRASDEHGLTGAQVQMLVDSFDGGDAANGNRARPFEVDLPGGRGDTRGVDDGVLGVAADPVGAPKDGVADRETAGVAIGRADDSGYLGAGDKGEVAGAELAPPRLSVPGTDTRSGDLHQQLAGTRDRRTSDGMSTATGPNAATVIARMTA